MASLFRLAIATVASLVCISLQAASVEPTLKLKIAVKMADACLELAYQNDWQVAVAVIDDGGNLKYFSRMDGASLLSADLSRDKALTSAKIALTTQKLNEMSVAEPTIRHIPGVVLAPGGFPIILDGRHVGGIGVSGASVQQDIGCAEAALSVVSLEKQ
tara:strand:+ start:666 stop:1142 length:477 start_codon:yes stop_codon:yes gene_type:complete